MTICKIFLTFGLFEIETGYAEMWTYSHGSLLMVICHMFV